MTQPFVRPDVRAFLDMLNGLNGPKSHEVGPEQARGMMHASRKLFDQEVGELAVIRDLAGGPCPMRLFDARCERGPGPVLVFYHGGGFVLGDLDTHASACAEIARLIDFPVVSVDYRLAPEHPFPAGVEDSIAATRWVADSPAELGRKVTGLIPCGDSAGGNFAIVATLALRDEPAAVPVVAQWPIYPAANPTEGYPSFTDFGEGYLLTREGMDWFDQCYAPDRKDWRYDPLHQDQRGMPPTLVVTASLDPIRDQGRAYAAACAQAGVSVIYLEAEGTIHGFLNLRKALPSAQADLERCIAHLKLLVA
ncbi:alpha/beta hydrolase [Sphingomonas sp. KRR8]|uniref:alpha/beta hydrolase n=1 Tax=Sphingomonas sp. KRR8 TaxID=2942996 RepID=UPI0020217D88|nr:alpha/beta hydrolase [Sphingomonas sp. KRR8]URD61180.1 alpha/beta hydrolase [Sphingomonas sp. KRR8]